MNTSIQQVAPRVAQEAQLPWLNTALPRSIAVDDAPDLSASPISRALALLQADTPDIYVVGDDGKVRRLDGVELEQTRDVQGHNAMWPLRSTSLSLDGKRAAFPQVDSVFVVDLAGAAPRAVKFPLPGFNEQVRWDPTGRFLLVGSAERTIRLDTQTTRIDVLRYSAFDADMTKEGAVLLTSNDEDVARPLLRRFDASGRLIDQRRLPSATYGGWWGATWSRGSFVARAAFARHIEGPGVTIQNPEVVGVLDSTTGKTRRILVINQEEGRHKGCCPVLGWLSDDTLLLGSSGSRILAWNFETGALAKVAETDPALISLSDISLN